MCYTLHNYTHTNTAQLNIFFFPTSPGMEKNNSSIILKQFMLNLQKQASELLKSSAASLLFLPREQHWTGYNSFNFYPGKIHFQKELARKSDLCIRNTAENKWILSNLSSAKVKVLTVMKWNLEGSATQVCKLFEELIYERSLKNQQYFCCGASCQGSDSLPRHWIFRTKELGHKTENLSIFPMKLTLKDEHSGY